MKVPGIVGGTTTTPLLPAANEAEPDSVVAPATPFVTLNCWTYQTAREIGLGRQVSGVEVAVELPPGVELTGAVSVSVTASPWESV